MTEVMALHYSQVYHPLRPKKLEKDYCRVSLCGLVISSSSEIAKEFPKGRRLCKHCMSYISRKKSVKE